MGPKKRKQPYENGAVSVHIHQLALENDDYNVKEPSQEMPKLLWRAHSHNSASLHVCIVIRLLLLTGMELFLIYTCTFERRIRPIK